MLINYSYYCLSILNPFGPRSYPYCVRNPSARTSFVNSGNRTNGFGDGCGFLVTSDRPGIEFSTHHPGLGRCQTFHGSTGPTNITGTTPTPTVGAVAGEKHSGPSTSHATVGDTSRRPVPSITVHRYANDPGPYGEREDVLVFIQKLTPQAHQLFVRLASNGKRYVPWCSLVKLYDLDVLALVRVSILRYDCLASA